MKHALLEVCLALGSITTSTLVCAQPLPSTLDEERSTVSEDARQEPERVIIALVQNCEANDLTQRVASWFSPKVVVQQRCLPEVSRQQVVEFDESETVAAWIFLREDLNVIYLTARKDGQNRFLRRDLQGGRSEEDLESLAQAVHYLITALWEGTVLSDEEAVGASGAELLGEQAGGAVSVEPPLSPPLSEPAVSAEPEQQSSTADRDPAPAPPLVDERRQLERERKKTAPPAVGSTSTARKGSIALDLGYGVNAQAHEPLAHGPGGGVGVYLSPRVRLSLSGRWIVPGRSRLGEIELQSSGVQGRIAALWLIPIVDQVALVAEASTGLSLVTWRELPGTSSNPGSGSDLRPFVGLGFGPQLSGGHLRVRLLGRLDAFLVRTRYVVPDVSEPNVVSRSGVVAPGGLLTLSYLFGPLGQKDTRSR